MSNRDEPRIGSTSAREQHAQTTLAVIGTLISASIAAAVALMWRTSERVIESTTKFEVQIAASAEAMRGVSERLDRIDATLNNHETRITVAESQQRAERAAAQAEPRRRPGEGGG